jgi:sulfonate transport system permease protein
MTIIDHRPSTVDVAAGPPPRSVSDITAQPPVLVRLVTGQGGGDGHRRWHLPPAVNRLLGVLALFAFWQLASGAGWLSSQTLAAPSTVLRAGSHLISDGTLKTALWASVQRVGWGLGIGIPLGAGLALIAGLSRLGDNLVDSNVQMLRFVPIIGLEPVLIMSLGIGETTKISLIVIGVAFPIYINTYSAIRSLAPGYHELSTVVGLGRVARLRRVVLPGVLPGFLVGLRMATGVAWLLLVFAEQVNAHSGLGFLMIQAQAFNQADILVFCLVVYAVLGLISDIVVRAIERRALRWQPGR